MRTDSALADRIEIADLFSRLARLLDEKRWAYPDAAAIFADDVLVRSPRTGELRGLDKLVAFLRQGEIEGVHTQHITTDLLVDLAGDHATTSAYSLVYFYRDGRPPHQTSGLRLAYTARRTPAGWRLSEGQVTLAWKRED